MPVHYTNLPDNKHRVWGGAYSVQAPDVLAMRNHFVREFTTIDSSNIVTVQNIKSEYVETYRKWLFAGFNFRHHELYRHACVTQGTTESFAHFYIRYREGYRLRIGHGDYFYHQMMKSLWYKDKFAWLDQDEIRPGDVVILSVPFSDTGDSPQGLEYILDQCEYLGVPVLLDMAYLNLCSGQSFPYVIDLSRDCIKYIVTSLSKVFPVENFRIGLRLQKDMLEDPLYVVNETNYNYINVLSAFIGSKLMQNYTNTHMFNRYRQQQIELCAALSIEVSPCFIFGIDHNNKFPEYNRGGPVNRLCFSRFWDGRSEKFSLSR